MLGPIRQVVIAILWLLPHLSLSASMLNEIATGSWPLGLERAIRIPEANTLTEAKVTLGRRLFFDKTLSRNGELSCATCHDPARGFSNGLSLAKGVSDEDGDRNVPPVFNRVLGTAQFWDGRAPDLETQALGPLLSPKEMGMDEALVIKRITADSHYRDLFQRAFNAPPSLTNLAKALACFQRTLVSGSTPFDQYEWGGVSDALSVEAKRGLQHFRGKARCSTCHIGTNFTDEKFHNLGSGGADGMKDPGLMRVTKDVRDFGRFRTPTLRNVSLTGPYMHDGSIPSLKEVVLFYNKGGRNNPNLDKEIKPLGLTEQEVEDLVSFLKSLTGPIISVHVSDVTDDSP